MEYASKVRAHGGTTMETDLSRGFHGLTSRQSEEPDDTVKVETPPQVSPA